MGLAEKVISLTFRTNINLHMFRDEFVVNKRVFHERRAHSQAVLDDSLITVDTTSLDQREVCNGMKIRTRLTTESQLN